MLFETFQVVVAPHWPTGALQVEVVLPLGGVHWSLDRIHGLLHGFVLGTVLVGGLAPMHRHWPTALGVGLEGLG